MRARNKSDRSMTHHKIVTITRSSSERSRDEHLASVARVGENQIQGRNLAELFLASAQSIGWNDDPLAIVTITHSSLDIYL